MPFKTDSQRKAFFAGRDNPRSAIAPQMIPNKTLINRFIALKNEGFNRKQANVIASKGSKETTRAISKLKRAKRKLFIFSSQ